MSHFKLILASITMMLAISAATAAGASAETCSGGTAKVFCNTELATLNGELIAGTGELTLIAGQIEGSGVKFDCTSNDSNGVLGKLGEFAIEVLMLKCTEEAPVGCHLTLADEKEIEALFSGQMESLTLALLTGGIVGGHELVAALHIQGATCTVEGEYLLTGRQKVELPNGAAGVLEQLILAKKAGGSLELDNNTATLAFKTKDALAGGFQSTGWLVMDGV